MSFSVRVLGSGSAVPTSKRKLTAQVVECQGRHVLIDCGEGTQTQFRKYSLSFQRIDIVLISHLHGDHYFGLVGLLSTMHLMGRVKDLSIYAPKELQEILRLQLEYNGSRLSFKLKFTALKMDSVDVLFEDNKILISSFPVSHRVPTCGFKIEEKPKELVLNIERAKEDGVSIAHYHRLKKGEDIQTDSGDWVLCKDYTFKAPRSLSYAFCADTRYFEPLVDSVKNVDLLYHEATFTEKFADRAKATRHSTAKQAATIALKSNCKKLLLGHLSARYESGEEHLNEAKTIFANTEVVEDGGLYLP